MERLSKKQKHTIIKELSKKKATNIRYSRGYISLNFNGHRIRDKIIRRHEQGIGNWARKKGVLYYDEHLQKRDIMPILVHEAVEKYAAQKYGLYTQTEAHKIAMHVERTFMLERCCPNSPPHSMNCWRRHEMRIQAAWLRENKLIRGREKRHKKSSHKSS